MREASRARDGRRPACAYQRSGHTVCRSACCDIGGLCEGEAQRRTPVTGTLRAIPGPVVVCRTGPGADRLGTSAKYPSECDWRSLEGVRDLFRASLVQLLQWAPRLATTVSAAPRARVQLEALHGVRVVDLRCALRCDRSRRAPAGSSAFGILVCPADSSSALAASCVYCLRGSVAARSSARG